MNEKNLKSFKCPCKEGYHVIDISIAEWKYVAKAIKDFGENTTITLTETQESFLVPRIYIAVHGIKAKALPFLGFKPI